MFVDAKWDLSAPKLTKKYKKIAKKKKKKKKITKQIERKRLRELECKKICVGKFLVWTSLPSKKKIGYFESFLGERRCGWGPIRHNGTNKAHNGLVDSGFYFSEKGDRLRVNPVITVTISGANSERYCKRGKVGRKFRKFFLAEKRKVPCNCRKNLKQFW